MYVPGGHEVHSEIPVPALYVPGSQAEVHPRDSDIAPVRSPYLPDGQFVQVSGDDVGLYVLISHAMHVPEFNQ